LTAATSVVWSFELTALSMMSLLASMGAPPTMTCAKAPMDAVPMARARTVLLRVCLIMKSPWVEA